MTPVPPATENAPGLSSQEAKALAHPSRAGIAEALGGSPLGMTVSELADHMSLHPNAIRQHLSVLQQAGVVTSQASAATGRRGRPSQRYNLVAPHGVAAVGHRELVRLLLEIVRRSGASEDVVEAFGMERGLRMAGSDVGGQTLALTGGLAGMGFAPEEVTSQADRQAGEMDLRLRACPFKEAVQAEGGHLICVLHRGLVRGVLERVNENAELAAFDPEDPVTAGCRVLIEGLDPR
ncbi:MAG: helix-turn-helix domain-containing protein [Thermoleophilia bacterium]